MTSISKQPTNKCDNKKGKIQGGSIAISLGLLIGGVIATIDYSAIAVAYDHTNELLECRQRLANSSEAIVNDGMRVNELQGNIWVTTNKYVFVIIFALVSMTTVAALMTTLPVISWNTWRKILTRKEQSCRD